MAPPLTARIRDALRSTRTCREEEQFGRLDGIRCHDYKATRRSFLLSVPLLVMNPAHASVAVELKAGNDTPLAEFCALRYGLCDVNPGVVLRSNRTDRYAARVACAGRTAVVSLRIPSGGRAQDCERLALDLHGLQRAGDVQI